MKCPACGTENKDNTFNCRKCATSLMIMWSPTWQWHAKTLGIIYACLIVAYFMLNWLLGPYLREIPPEVTPWLSEAKEIHK